MLVEAEEKSKRRGRPPGKARVSREAGLRLHDLAFARAVVQGVNLGAAAERYLPELPGDERVANSYFRRLAASGADVLLGMGEREAAKALKAWVDPPQADSVDDLPEAATPSLDEFAEEVGIEDFSEREILEMYQERYGARQPVAAPAASKPAASKVLEALSVIQSRGLVLPKPTDVPRLWFSAGLERCLSRAGIDTLEGLVRFVNHWGAHWYRRVPGIGKCRGSRVLQWLGDHQSYLGEVLVTHAETAPAAAELVEGHGALLRSSGANALGAKTDREALNSWLATLDFVSPHTKRAYARDVGRLLVWAQEELGRGLSELTVTDAAAHARFLQAPPEKWIAEPGRRRNLPITMRAGLAPTSTARALAAIGHFYGFLVETQYLRANPFARIRAPQDKGVQMDVQRCFSNAHLQAIQLALTNMPDTPRKRRWVAILALLEGTGLRIGEIPVSWSSIVEVADPEAGKIRCLKVHGKGGRERILPLKSEVLDALETHRADQLVDDASAPLIGLIDEPVHAREEARGGALSTARMRVVLKDLFRIVADQVPTELAEDFRRASPHFMRHTFAHRVLSVTKQDLAVTQQLLGHKSISTTGIYIKAGLSQRFEALSALSLGSINAEKEKP